MKRMKRVLALGMAVLMCMGLTACGKDFDAAGYTKSVLDANYHAQYDKYAEYRGISESDAKKEVTEGMRTQIESAFSGMDVSDEMMDKYIEVAEKAMARRLIPAAPSRSLLTLWKMPRNRMMTVM